MHYLSGHFLIFLVIALGVTAVNADDSESDAVVLLNIFGSVVPVPGRYVIAADRLNERVEIQLLSLAASDSDRYKAGVIKIGRLEDDKESDEWFESNAYRKAHCADLSLFSAKAGDERMHWFRGKEKYMFMSDNDPFMADRIWSHLLSQKPERLSCSEAEEHNNAPHPTQ